MLSPYDQIRGAYCEQREEGMLTWEELVGWHLGDPCGYVIKRPDFFVMGRAVIKAAGANVTDLRVRFEPSKCDAWFLYGFAGSMQAGLAALPFELPWLAWERYGDPLKELRFVSTASIRAFIQSDYGK